MDKIHNKIKYDNEELTYIQIIEKQVKNIKNSIDNNEKYTVFKINW